MVKQPCDGIGGTVKQLVSSASLKCDSKDQTLSPSDMLKFCKENMQNIIFKFISKADVDNMRVILNERFEGQHKFQAQDHFMNSPPKINFLLR